MTNPLDNLYAYIRKSTNKREIMDEETARLTGYYVSLFFQQQNIDLTNSLALRNRIRAYLVSKTNEHTGELLAVSSKQLIARIIGSYCVDGGWLSAEDYGILCRYFKPVYSPWSEKALSDEQVKKLVGWFYGRMEDSVLKKRYVYRSRDLLAVMIMLAVGLRIGQVTHLQQQDVEMKRGTFIVRPIFQKRSANGKSEKVIPMNIVIGGVSFSEAAERYEKHRLKSTEHYFYANGKESISEDYYRGLFEECEDALGFSVSAHFLRHTAGTRTANKVGITAAANLLDHQSIQTTQRYVTLTKDTSDIVSRSFQ